MTGINYCVVVKKQLWDYYRVLNDCASDLSSEVVGINFATGEIGKYITIPAGLRDDLDFIRDEIALWGEYEKDLRQK